MLVTDFPITQTPVIVSDQKTNGWRDLIRKEAGGGAKGSYVRHTFDGKTYVKRERMPIETTPKGTTFLGGEVTYDEGIPLKPRS